MPEATLPPVELHTRDEGQGPVVVLLHGVGLTHAIWNGIIPGLTSEFRVIAPDLRGHGKSPNPPNSQFTLPELEGDVLNLLDAKSVDSAYVVGHSGGALLALRLALDHPDRVRGLVVVCGAGYVDTHTRSIVQRWNETYDKEGPDAYGLRILKDLYYPDWIEAHLDFADQVRAAVKHQDLGPSRKWNAALDKFDEKSRVASLKIPTLIVQAMDDQVVDASHGRILRQSIPGAQIRILADTGHMVPLERPKETLEAVARFLRAAEERRAASTSTA
jgi:(E)-2-((N-methylformamido)methylene)succinate hydrolase